MFVVFGKSKVKAREKAIKDIAVSNLTLEAYSAKVDKVASDYYEHAKCVKISPVYSNVERAKEYMAMNEKADTASEMFVKKMDERTFNPETGRYSCHWSEM